MKTVMKKMFSLLLVAVLLVGVMPFQASANGVPYYQIISQSEEKYFESATLEVGDTYELSDFTIPSGYELSDAVNNGNPLSFPFVAQEGDIIQLLVDPIAHSHDYTSEITTAATCTSTGVKTYTCACGDSYTDTIPATDHKYDNGVITTKPTCSATGIKTYTCANNSSHTYTEEVAAEANAHDFSSKNVCNYCKLCKNCNLTDAHKTNCIYYCNGKTDCPNDRVPGAHNEGCLKTKCNQGGCDLPYGHTGECRADCNEEGCILALNHAGEHNKPCTTAGCTLGYKHTEKHHSNVCSTCELPKIKSPEHKSNCDYYYVNAEPTVIPGDSYLSVYVNLYTSDVKTKTVHLKTYKNISEDTKIYSFIADHAQDLEQELINDGYGDYSWSGNVYNSKNDRTAVSMKATVGTGATVHINAYTGEDLVLIYVHNSRSYNELGIVRLPGKRVGETVTKKEVLSAVSKTYNVSSLSMYDDDAWEAYVAGKSVESVDSLKVNSKNYRIDVKISGSAKSSSSSTADSTNPKTGDAIFAPAMVMGLSASALVVLYYLNKKRAY